MEWVSDQNTHAGGRFVTDFTVNFTCRLRLLEQCIDEAQHLGVHHIHHLVLLKEEGGELVQGGVAARGVGPSVLPRVPGGWEDED